MARGHQQIEIELKYSLSKIEYLKLQKHLKPYFSDQKRQDNYYFDTPELLLKKNKIGLRIRLENSKKAIATIKFPKDNSKSKIKALKIRHEIENSINLSNAKLICRNRKSISSLNSKATLTLKKKISALSASQIICLGKLTNHRTVYQYAPQLTLELDRSNIFGKFFYELEIETLDPHATDRWVKALLKTLKIRVTPEETSKLQRFFTEWNKQNKRSKDKP